MDESTLVRSKVNDDEYEIMLRKKALASILNQVEKTFSAANQYGIKIGGDLTPCMTKFDEGQLKLRRAFSLEEINEEEWSSDGGENLIDLRGKRKGPEDVVDIQNRLGERRHSFPLSPRSMAQVPSG